MKMRPAPLMAALGNASRCEFHRAWDDQLMRGRSRHVWRARLRAPASVRMLVTVPTFVVVVVVVGVSFGDATSAPVISGAFAVALATGVIELLWVRQQRPRSRDDHER